VEILVRTNYSEHHQATLLKEIKRSTSVILPDTENTAQPLY